MGLLYNVIGIAGTAKNTGKTTTTNYLLDMFKKKGFSTGLTSIGYDGERLDNVTGLPKPRIPVSVNTTVAVARRCLPVSTARIQVIKETPISTPLGNIIIGRVEKEGLVVIAGPNKSSDLRIIINELKTLDLDIILVDGALNRLAPMVETEGFILATGAARSPDITRLAYETHSIAYLFGLPQLKERLSTEITVQNGFRKKHRMGFASLFTNRQLFELLEHLTSETKRLEIPGVVQEKLWKQLGEHIISNELNFDICVADPIKLALAGGVGNIHRLFERLENYGVKLLVAQKLPLVAVTVNPFFPKYRFEAQDYEPAYVDAVKLVETVDKVISVPAIDIKRNGDILFKALFTGQT